MASEAGEPSATACIFNCQRKEELKIISAQRFTSIVKGSKALNDGLYKTFNCTVKGLAFRDTRLKNTSNVPSSERK